MARSVWKGPYCSNALFGAVVRARNVNATVVKTRCRRSVIVPDFVGMTFYVYNGAKYLPVSVTEDMIGHKLGEFSPTRVFKGHAGKRVAKRG